MLTRFSIETSCEDSSESQKLYVVMEVDSSWHLYPEYALIGIYTSKEVAIKVAREQVESIEKTNNWIIENDLFDSDDCENTAIHFDEIEVDDSATTAYVLFALGKYGEYSLLGYYNNKELAEKRRALLQKRDDEIIKMAKNYEDAREYFVVESQINKET